MDPVISGIETDFKDQAIVERYDASSEEGKQLMSQYSLTDNPSYVMVDTEGTKLWSNTGPMHKDMLRQQVILHAKQ